MSLLLWWKFGSLKSSLLAGKGALYDAKTLGGKNKFAVGSAVQLNDTRYATSETLKGAAAWDEIESDPDAISAALTCARCGFRHVIRAGFSSGMEQLTGGRFGRFDDRYQGLWQGSWFKLYAPLVGRQNELVCQSCNAAGVPGVSLY